MIGTAKENLEDIKWGYSVNMERIVDYIVSYFTYNNQAVRWKEPNHYKRRIFEVIK